MDLFQDSGKSLKESAGKECRRPWENKSTTFRHACGHAMFPTSGRVPRPFGKFTPLLVGGASHGKSRHPKQEKEENPI
jgi:hypothetical protein